jgi:hypothetical protein
LKYGSESENYTTRDTNAPRLLGADERARLRRLIAGAGSPIIVVAPAPVFGFRPIEEMQELAGGLSPAGGDFESWAANPRNTVDFVRLLGEEGIDQAIVLSGDVHYAFEMAVTVSLGSRTIHVAQFCSSAMKNRPTGVQLIGSKILRHTGLRKRAISWWVFGNDDGAIYRLWNTRTRLYNKTLDDYGDPTFIVSEFLHDRDGGGVIIKNNIGEFIVNGTEVQHRFWLPRGPSDFAPTDFTVWEPAAWPAPRAKP